jgi:3-hydroxyacyl-CoA dehydrogenase
MASTSLGIVGTGVVACGLAEAAARQIGPPLVLARTGTSAARAQAELGPAARVTTVLADIAECSVVVEAVAEDHAIKSAVLGDLHHAMAYDAVLMTTTSSLSVNELADASGRPDRFVGLHVFTPVPVMPLVELVVPDRATDDARRRALHLCAQLEKTAVEVPDTPGFIVNRVLFPFLFDAVRLLDVDGIAPETVDTCVRLGAAHPMGPLALLDAVGLDVAVAIGEQIGADVPARLRRLIDERKLGRKAGVGFYEYR